MELLNAIDLLYRRVLLTVGRGRVMTGNDTAGAQLLQVQLGEDELRDNTPRLGEYGFASMPTNGSDIVMVFVGGDRSNGVIIATGNQAERLRNLQPGEAAIYDSLGKYIYLTQTGIVVEAKGQPVTVNDATDVNVNATGTVTVNAPAAKITGTLEVDGNVTLKGICAVMGALSSATSVADPTGTMQSMRTVYDGHEHPVTGVATGSGSVTSNVPNQLM